MEWFFALVLPTHSDAITSAQSLVVIFFVISLGIFLGRLSFKNISLGNAGIMFSGLLLGHLGYSSSPQVLEFLKDMGIMLFVYGIGIQVGPYFFSSFQKQGLQFNLLALSTVFLGVIFTVILFFTSGLGMDTVVGIMSGAVTNTPGLGAAQAAISDASHQLGKTFFDPANAYAIAYPIGVLGIIFVIAISKFLLRVDIQKEIESYENAVSAENTESPKVVRCRITNTNFEGKKIIDIIDVIGKEKINISRFRAKNTETVVVPTKETVLHLGDSIVIIGLKKDLKIVIPLLGEEIFDMSLEESADVLTRKFVVTRKTFAGKPLEISGVQHLYNIRVTRISRGDIEFLANTRNRLLFGDHITVVGTEKDLRRFEALVGNNPKYLSESNLMLITIGLLLGILVGSIPFFVPGLAAPIKLGMAAGPLLVALFISRYAPTFGISAYMNKGSVTLLKDLGIALFFATVGLKAGAHFYETFVQNNGLLWVVYAFLITSIPLLTMFFVGYKILKINFLQLTGVLSASYTDSIALLFSTAYFKTDIPNQSYVLTYPFSNIARILLAQLLVIFFL